MIHRVTRLAAALAATVAVVAAVLLAAAPAAEGADAGTGVVPIDWDEFDGGLPDDDQAQRTRSILLNANRYAMQTWFPSKYGSQTGDYLDLGGVAEGNIRPPGSEALALATSLASGAYDETVVGAPRSQATEVATRIVSSIAYRHSVNSPNGWGNAWQSALWAFNAAFAGWLLWDELPTVDQQRLERMVVAEADRFLFYEVPYYQLPDGTVVTPGDSKAEENAWNAAFLNLAVAMLPTHPNRAVWQDKAIELMVSAYSRPGDQTDPTLLNGKPVRAWLNGSNIFEDGTLVNHSRIHPDYFTSIANSVGAPLAYGLAGLPTPRAALFNADVVYAALVDHEFAAPPYTPPGGTIYLRDTSGNATADIYYPQGNDWGTSRQLHFLLLDTLAASFGFDDSTSVPAADWAAAHADRALQMQSRFADGRTYGAPSEDTYSGREEWVALLAGRTYLTHWLAHNGGVTFTDQAYPVTPRDYPGAEVSFEAPAQVPVGGQTAVSVTVTSRSEDPLLGLRAGLEVPDGWSVVFTAALPSTLQPGTAATATWLLTPRETGDPDAATSARLDATVAYRHLGVHRTATRTHFVAVPPGVNLALGAPVEASSALRPTSGGDKAVDGGFTDASRWVSAADDLAPWLRVDLGTAQTIERVDVYSGYVATNHDPTTTLKDFVVEVHTADGWVPVAEVTDNVEHHVVLDDLAVTGDHLRLAISDPSGSTTDVARVFEIEVYGGTA